MDKKRKYFEMKDEIHKKETQEEINKGFESHENNQK
jgi:hypothetical protein